jgi:hypothetical protein
MRPLGTLETLAYVVGATLAPLAEDLSAARLPKFLLELGLGGPLNLSADQLFQQKLAAGISAIEAVSSKLELLDEAGDADDSEGAIKAGAELLAAILAAREALTEIASDLKRAAASTPLASSAAELSTQLVDRLFDYSLIRYLEQSHPTFLSVLEFLTVVDVTAATISDDPNEEQILRRRLQLDRLTTLIKNPSAVFELTYGWGTNNLNAEMLYDRLARLLLAVNILTGDAFDDLGEPAPGLDLFDLTIEARTDQNPNGLVATLTTSSQPTTISLLTDSPHWKLDLEFDGAFQEGLQVSLLPPAQVELTTFTGAAPGGAHFRFISEAADASTPLLLLGITGGSRVEAKRVKASAGAKFTSNQQGAITGDVVVDIDVAGGKALLVLDSEDGFLSQVLPKELSVDFECGLNWSAGRGLSFRGSASLEATIPVGLSLGGFSVPTLHLGIHAGDTGLTGEVSASVALSIGPVLVMVHKVGLKTLLTFPEDGGNLGPCNLALEFKPPSGGALEIDAAFLTGGGALIVEPEKHQYVGVLSLTLTGGITITAVAVITTRLPNGVAGFSFVVMITATGFKPIPLGLGFTLTAIGGLLAVNRTCDEEFLRQGIKDQTLNHLLFPQDPIRNAAQLIGALNNAFPPRVGSLLFGPVIQISWGTPTLIKMDLGLLLELGARRRLIILGRVSAIMPTEEHDLIRLQMNAIGVIDFDQSSVSVDAVLYDSRLAGKFPLTGSMALRLNWGSQPIFALSIGGFHPAFKPPPQFPVLERLAISFSSSSTFRLRAECYLALTANTLQFGAKVELYAKAGDFSIEGRAGFDVLIQFVPFAFVADFYAKVQLKYGSRNLFAVKVEGAIAGPKPLHVKGKASFEIFWCDFSVRFDKTLISGEQPPNANPVVVFELLKAALLENRNWSDQVSEIDRRPVSLRDRQTDQLTLHPLGTLSVKQTVVPLDLTIDKFGNATPSDARLFEIGTVTVNGDDTPFVPVEDFFAPAEFLELTDDEKLASPSFELMPAGFRVGKPGLEFAQVVADIIEDEVIKFETIIVDKKFEAETGKKRKGLPHEITLDLFDRHISLGAAAQRSISRKAARALAEERTNSEGELGWTIVSTIDGSAQAAPEFEPGTVSSYAKSLQAYRKLKAEDSEAARERTLVRVLRPKGSRRDF